ncbi:MAG: F0F1 ATP synthase subunit B [Bacteroidales bacterium]|jgi:F-type H+-transporting ATPase subunit b|nr:F0F1 ATP synthase subunit B [Bacteroidales bacterium]
MELVTPGLGLLFWTVVIFLILFLLLKRFAFPAISKMLAKREEGIANALQQAEEARRKMEEINASNTAMLREAAEEREATMRKAKEEQALFALESKENAQKQYDKMLFDARQEIEREKQQALEELRSRISDISIEMAEKILQNELSDREKQKQLIEKELNAYSL